MKVANVVARTRSRVLHAVFQLLYTRLGFLHETAGRAVYGHAWDGRRRHVLPGDLTGGLLDIGCGDGRLLSAVGERLAFTLGIEPSPDMARRARRRDVRVVIASALALPLRDDAVQHIVATYPGPWIVDPRTWDEIARVTSGGATVSVLLGGDIRRGRGSTVRGLLLRLAYGGRHGATERLPQLGNALVSGEYGFVEDEWGTAMLWKGNRHAR